MTTFSQLVDSLAIVELKRPDLLASTASWLNQTIRDVHSKAAPARSAVMFGENRVEEEFIPAELPAVWPIPNVARFQKLEAVYAPQRGVYLKDKNPGIVFNDTLNPMDRFFYYRTGSNFAFNGIAESEPLNLTYFLFPPYLNYYPVASRPITWDLESEAFVLSGSWGGTLEEAMAKSTNWLLIRHYEALKAGVRHKMYIRTDSLERAKLVWSDFEATREAIHHLEAA